MNVTELINKQINTEYSIIKLLEEATRTERFLSKPKPPKSPSMYDLLQLAHQPDDYGYYTQVLKLRATPKQIARWEFAIDILCMVKDDISKDPILDRNILWLRAKRLKWTELGRHFGFDRNTIKRRYDSLLSKLYIKIKNKINSCKLNELLYLI